MLVIISGDRQFETYKWQDILSGTWGDIKNNTWYSHYLLSNNTLMLSPTPEVTHRVDKRSTASFTLLDIGAINHFKKGNEVSIGASDASTEVQAICAYL